MPRLIFGHMVVAASLASAVSMTSFAARTAAAQSINPDKKNQARRYVDSGLAAHEAGDYDTALIFLSKAYELVPHPLLLFNMAQSHRLAGRLDKALEHYQRYLQAEPKGSQSQAAREYVATLKDQVAKEAARKAAEQRAAEESRQVEEARAAEEARRAAVRGRRLRVAGVVTAGAGLAGFGVALAFDLKARSLSDELSGPNAVYDPGKVDQGNMAERTSHVALAAGIILAAGGATLYWAGRWRARTERLVIAPLIAPTGIGLAISGGVP